MRSSALVEQLYDSVRVFLMAGLWSQSNAGHLDHISLLLPPSQSATLTLCSTRDQMWVQHVKSPTIFENISDPEDSDP